MNKLSYQDYLKSDHWKAFRARKARKKNGLDPKCEICRTRGKVDIHHLVYEINGKSILFQEHKPTLQNMTKKLCRECHYLSHQYFKGRVFAHRRGKIGNLLSFGVPKEEAFRTVATPKAYKELYRILLARKKMELLSQFKDD